MAQNTVKIQAPSIVAAAVCTPWRSNVELGKTGITSLIYLLVVATLGEELRSWDRPGQKRKRAATLVHHGHSHVRTTQIGGWRSLKTVGHMTPGCHPLKKRGRYWLSGKSEDTLVGGVLQTVGSTFNKMRLTRFYKGISFSSPPKFCNYSILFFLLLAKQVKKFLKF